jgi:lipopolysaccharide/colanic/teichoic acid biosynthesis glycosyltransferase
VGTYELRQAQSPGSTKQSGKTDLVAAAAVNVDPAESDLRQVSVDELAAFWSRIGVRPEQARQIAAGETLDAAVLEARFGVELWKYFVGIAVMLALLEMAIGREPKSTSEQ